MLMKTRVPEFFSFFLLAPQLFEAEVEVEAERQKPLKIYIQHLTQTYRTKCLYFMAHWFCNTVAN